MAQIKNKTTNIYTEWKPLIEALSNEDAGKLLKDILKYQANECVDNNNPVWLFIKSKIDEYNEKGKQVSEKRKENGRLGGLAKASKCQQELANDGKSSNKIKENKIKENKYIFNGYTIKLNEKDYNSWKEEYNLLDLDYELKQIDNYLQMEENKPKQKSWFFFAKSWLNKNQKRAYDKLPKGMDGKPIKNYHEW